MFAHKRRLTYHQNTVHATQKDWICDCCGSRFGIKNVLKLHMKIHLPPSFACSKCDRKFVRAGSFKTHLKVHAGILNEICKICNKGYSTQDSLRTHIMLQHFSNIHCEIPGCLYKTGFKSNYKKHLKGTHKNINKNVIEKLIEKLRKIRPDYRNLKYV